MFNGFEFRIGGGEEDINTLHHLRGVEPYRIPIKIVLGVIMEILRVLG